MAFDESKKKQFSKLLEFLLPEAAKAISPLLNSEVQIKMGSWTEAKSSEGQIAIDEENEVLFSAEFSNPEKNALGILSSKKLAWIISDLMTGGEANWTDEVAAGEIKLTAFSEPINQTLSSLANKLKAKNNAATLDLQEGQLGQNENLNETIAFSLRITIPGKCDEEFHFEISEAVAKFLNDSFAEASQIQNGDAREDGVANVEFANLHENPLKGKVNEGQNLNLLMDIRMGLTVELGRSEMPLREILKLTKGSVIELDRLSGEPVDLFVNNKLIARGEVVVIDDNFGLRITQLAGNLNLAQEMGLAAAAND